MKIHDPYSDKVRDVRDLKMVKYKSMDKKGKPKSIPYVEFTVIGRNSNWKNAMSLKDFERLNPGIKI